MEHWEAIRPGGYRFVWDDDLFRPGTDTFLLSSLPRLKAGMRVLELGCGTGLLSMLLLQRQPQLLITGIDIQPDAIRLAQKAVLENHLQDHLSFRTEDLRTAALGSVHFDLVVCNPPYFPPGSGASAPDAARRTAREEVACTLDDVCSAAARSLRWGGSFCLVHRPERLVDVLTAMRSLRLEPKRLRFIQKTAVASPSLFLVEGRLGGNPGLTVETPLILQQADGSPSEELDAIYYRTNPTTEETI